MSDWVKFHRELCQGAKRGIPRAYRYVYMELSLAARKLRGVVELPSGMGDVEGVCDILGGDLKEVRGALAKLTGGQEPMIVFEGEPGARRLVVSRWTKWNAFEPPGASTERSRRHRAAAQQGTLPGMGNAHATEPQRSLHDVANEPQRSFSIRGDQKREDLLPGDSQKQFPPAGRVPSTAAAQSILDALASSEKLKGLATGEFANRLAAHANVDGHPGAKSVLEIVNGIREADQKLANEEAVGEMSSRSRQTALVVSIVKAPTRAERPAMGRGRGMAEVQRSPGWEAVEAKQREEFEAEQERLKASPDYQEPAF